MQKYCLIYFDKQITVQEISVNFKAANVEGPGRDSYRYLMYSKKNKLGYRDMIVYNSTADMKS